MRVSIVCPVFDTPAPLLEAALASVRDQDPDGICEIILVDDGSRAPDTLRALDRARGPRTRLLSTGGNRGPASARNAALGAARGDWIGFLDSDDLWRPDQLGRFMAVVGDCPEAAWIAGNHAILDDGGRQEALPRIADEMSPGAPCGDAAARLQGAALTRHLASNTRLHLGATFMRRDLLRRAGGFADGLMYGEDWLLFVRLSTLSPLHAIAAETYLLRRQQRASIMRSTRRLSGAYAAAQVLARRDPLLRGFRRELRWSLYSTLKGLALNNLQAGRPWTATRFALRAWALDPREARDLTRFFRLLALPARRRSVETAYSRAERFMECDAA